MSLSQSSWIPDAGGGGRQEEEVLYKQLYSSMYVHHVPLYILLPVFQNSVRITLLCAIVASQTIFSLLPLSHTQGMGDKCCVRRAYFPGSIFYLILSNLSLCNAIIIHVLMVPLTAITFFVKRYSFLICNLIIFLLSILALRCKQLLYYPDALKWEIFVQILYNTE